MRAVIYARISKDTAHDELGVMRQEADCRALCERHGYEVASVEVDDDRSAYSGKRRPGYRRALDLLRDGEAGVLVAWHPDRITRQPRELEDLIDLLESSGATVHTVQAGEVDLSTASGRMVARVVGAMARHESEHKSARLRRKHEELAAAGKSSGGGRRAFGYDGAGLVVRLDEAAEIRRAVADVLDGVPLRAVVADWTARGIVTPTGAPWRPLALRRMLASARIAGQRSHRGAIVTAAAWPAIIGADDHRRIVALFAARTTPARPRSYVLAGLVRCSACGASMVARSAAKGQRSYTCASDAGGCGGRRIMAEPLEALVVDAVLARLAGAPQVSAPVLADPIAGELAAIDAKVAELGEMWAAGEVTRDGWRAASEALAARRAALGASLAGAGRRRAVSNLPSDPEALRATWGTWGIDRRRALLAEVVERVEIAPARRGANRFDDGRVRVVWLA